MRFPSVKPVRAVMNLMMFIMLVLVAMADDPGTPALERREDSGGIRLSFFTPFYSQSTLVQAVEGNRDQPFAPTFATGGVPLAFGEMIPRREDGASLLLFSEGVFQASTGGDPALAGRAPPLA